MRGLVRSVPAALAGAAAIALLAAIAYQPFVTASYAYKDDYTSLRTAGQPGLDGMSTVIARGGRILYAVLSEIAFGLCRGIGDLRFLRAAGALGAVVLGFVVARAARDRGARPAEAWLAGAGTALLPAVHVFVGWSVAFPFPWAAAAAVAAGVGAARAAERWRQGARRRALATAAGAIALLLVALHVYQPVAQFVFVPLAAGLVFAPPGGGRAARHAVAAGVASFAVAGVAHVAIFRSYVGLFPDGALERSAFVVPAQIGGRIVWYLTEALPNALRVFVVDPSPAVAVGVALVAAAGLALGARRRGETAAGVVATVATGAALLPAAYAANLVVAAPWAAYRTTGAAAAISWIFLIGGLGELAGRRARARRIVLALLGAVVVAQALQIRLRIVPLVAGVQLREMALLRARVAALVESGRPRVAFRLAHWSDAGVRPVRYDEIGVPSSSADWAPQQMIDLFHRELTGRVYRGAVTVVGPEEPWPRRGFRIDAGAELRGDVRLAAGRRR